MNQEKNNQESIDLSGVFKNSEAKVKTEQKQSTHFFQSETPRIIKWTIKYSGGLIKNGKQANYVVLCFIALMIVISLFLIFNRKTIKIEPLPPEIINAPQPRDGVMPR